MQLLELIAQLTECSEQSFIFAGRIAGKFRPESDAVVVELSESELRHPLSVVAAERAPGMDYFLEASIVLEMQEELRAQRHWQQKDVRAIVERIIRYADNDA